MKNTPRTRQPLSPPILGLDRDAPAYDMFFSDGRAKAAFEVSARSVISWLNGWETAEGSLKRMPPEGRQRTIDRVYGGDIKGKKTGMDDHTAESRDRIFKLLEALNGFRERLKQAALEEDHLYKPGDPARFSAKLEGQTFVMGFGDPDRFKMYATFPQLFLHTRTGRWTVKQRTLASNTHTLEELTPEEKAEIDPRKRQRYSVGPGQVPPAPTPEESAALKSFHAGEIEYPKLGTKERALLDAWHQRVDAAATHKWTDPAIPYGEVFAAHGIFELARQGELWRVRQCRCKTWFYAKRKDGKNCSPECNRANYEKGEKGRETKAKAARWYNLRKKWGGVWSEKKLEREFAKNEKAHAARASLKQTG